MPDKYFDNLFPDEKVCSAELRGYVWKVIVDPCPGYLSHPPGFLNVKQAKVVTINQNYFVSPVYFPLDSD